MAYDLTKHFPFGPPEGIVEGNYLLKAWQPNGNAVRQEAVIEAFRDGELVQYVTVPMNHSNQWGVDFEDVADIERATDAMLNDLP